MIIYLWSLPKETYKYIVVQNPKSYQTNMTSATITVEASVQNVHKYLHISVIVIKHVMKTNVIQMLCH